MPVSKFATSAADHAELIHSLRGCRGPLSPLRRLTFGKDRNAGPAKSKQKVSAPAYGPTLRCATFRVPSLRIAPWRTLATAIPGLARSLGVVPRATTPALLQSAS
jgi:hypothetical protein